MTIKIGWIMFFLKKIVYFPNNYLGAPYTLMKPVIRVLRVK